MHWHFHFDGKQQTPIRNETTKLSLLQSISNYDDLDPLSSPVKDSSDDSSNNSTRNNTRSMQGGAPRRRRERIFHRKSVASSFSNNSTDGDKSESSVSCHDEHAKAHFLFQIHAPWKNIKIKKPRRTTSFNSLSSFDVSDAEITHVDETEDTQVDSNPKSRDQVHVKCLSSPKSVHFSTVQIREYDLILGDHPYCSNGVPTQLGWIHVERKAVNLDHYECLRSPKRKSASQFRISATARKDLLANSENDYTKADFRRAERKLYKDRSKKDTQKFFNMS